MARTRECLKCGDVFEGRGSYCQRHPFGVFAERPRSKVYGSQQWRRITVGMRREHVAQYGLVCPGDGPAHPPHPVGAISDLSVDHIHRLSAGGAPFDRANLRVLCVARNAQRGLARAGS